MDGLQRRLMAGSVGMATVGAAFFFGADPAAGDNWGSSQPAGDPQNAVSLGGGSSSSTHSISFHDVAAMRQPTLDALNNVYDNVSGMSVQVNADNGSADVRVFEDFYGLNGAYGWANCPSDATVSGSHPTRRCFNQTVKYNDSYGLTALMSSSSGRKALACQELGHTLGLRHAFASNHPNPGGTCMSGFLDSTSPYPQAIVQHDADLVSLLN